MIYVYLDNIIYIDSLINKCEFDIYPTSGDKIHLMRLEDDMQTIFTEDQFLYVPKFNGRFAYINKKHIISFTIDSSLPENKYEQIDTGKEPRFQGEHEYYRKIVFSLTRSHTIVSMLTKKNYEEMIDKIIEPLPVGFLV